MSETDQPNVTTVTDSKGRKLSVRRLNVLEQVRLLRAIGPEQSSNEPYVNIVQMAASVTAIDGAPLPDFKNERQIDAAIARIGDEGFAALMVDMQRKLKEIREEAEAAAESAIEGASAGPLAQSA